MHKPRRKQPKLYQNSKTLKVLSALANGTLEIGAALAEATQSRGVSEMLWRKATGKTIQAPKIDLARMRAVASERAAYRRALKTIMDRREVRMVKRKRRWIVEVTDHGKRRLLESEIKDLAIGKPKTWDGRWRIILYDIPDSQSTQRDILRDRLKRLGFFPLQKSTFVLPYPCEDELDVLIQHLGIAEHVTFFATNSLGYQEAEALFFFGLEPNP